LDEGCAAKQHHCREDVRQVGEKAEEVDDAEPRLHLDDELSPDCRQGKKAERHPHRHQQSAPVHVLPLFMQPQTLGGAPLAALDTEYVECQGTRLDGAHQPSRGPE